MSLLLAANNNSPIFHVTSTTEIDDILLGGTTASTMYNSSDPKRVQVHSTLEAVLSSDSLNFQVTPGDLDQLTYFTVLPGLTHNEYITKQRMPHTISIYSDVSVIGTKHLNPISIFTLNSNNNDYVSQVGYEVALATVGILGLPNPEMYIGFNVSTGLGNSAYNNRNGIKVKITWYDIEVKPDSTIDPPLPDTVNSIELQNGLLEFNGEPFDKGGLLLVRKSRYGAVSSNYNIYSTSYTTNHALAISNSSWPTEYPIVSNTTLHNDGVTKVVRKTSTTATTTLQPIGGDGRYTATFKDISALASGATYIIPEEGVWVVSLAPVLDGSMNAAVVGAPMLMLTRASADGEYVLHEYHRSIYLFTARYHYYLTYSVTKVGISVTYNYKVDGVPTTSDTKCNIITY